MFLKSLKSLLLTFNSKRSILKLISVIFIPLIYGIIYIGAFWNPFGNLDKLPFAIVYNNQNTGSKVFVDLMKKSLDEEYHSHIHPQLGKFKITVNYVDQKDPSKFNYKKNSHQYPFAITISNDFTDRFIHYLTYYSPDKEKPKLNFYSSYKYNFIIGELGNFFSFALNNIINKEFSMFFLKIALIIIYDHNRNTFLNNFQSIYHHLTPDNIYDQTKNLVNKISPNLSNIQNKKIINQLFSHINKSPLDWWKDPGINLDVHNQGSNAGINIYGYGLAPFFICIAIWIGATLHISIYSRKNFENPRQKEKLSIIFKELLAKLLFINIISIAQWIILLVSLVILGLHFHYFGLFLFFSIISVLVFNFIIFVIFELFYSDLARFISIVILIFQLVSSGGIFPVITQNVIFQFFNHFNIFYYFISGLREFYIATSFINIFINFGFILIFFLVFLIILLLKKIIHCVIHNKKLKMKLALIAQESLDN